MIDEILANIRTELMLIPGVIEVCIYCHYPLVPGNMNIVIIVDGDICDNEQINSEIWDIVPCGLMYSFSIIEHSSIDFSNE